MLRHSYINNQDFNKLTEGDKKELAHNMTHSVPQQGQYRHIVKVDEVVEEKQEAKDDTVVQSTESIQPVDNDTTKKQDISKIIEEMNKQHQDEMKMLMEQMQKKHEERINAIVTQFG
jgi:formate dehydrogenase maturation protein FdhE